MTLLKDVLIRDTFVSLPAAGVEGRIFFASDTGQILYDNGATWDDVTDDLSALFSEVGHDHDLAYAAIAHDHDLVYAAIAHDHDLVYAAIAHDHDLVYAAIAHDHDLVYAAIAHDHDGDYSAIDHNHDGDYAALAHTHTGQMMITFEGDLAVDSYPIRYYNNLGRTITISKVTVACETGPTGANGIFDLHKNGADTIFTNQAHRPTITAGNNTGATTDIDVATLADGDYLQMHIDQIGSTIAGSDLTLCVVYS